MYKRLTIAVFAVAGLTAAGCSSDSQDSIRSDVESAASEVSSAVDDAVTEVSQAADDAVTAVSSAAEEAGTDAAEAAARNIATQQGEEQFKDAGHELDGPLTCEATATEDASAVDIDCTGTTKDGGAATLTGTTSEMPGASVTMLEGQFSGAVDGTEVFSTQELGG